jgi:hypothetical protein
MFLFKILQYLLKNKSSYLQIILSAEKSNILFCYEINQKTKNKTIKTKTKQSQAKPRM